ncbi:hypothetical protein [Paludisphaera borealis]|uniref:Uncharacterized protein n=1 Tax=Paludisphaera borealis TaxID=1387353 RepID=A0A1U7CNF6_9BACT|nr:hypothetical protein [Paludisphaera borealis]APW60470.1 hypothetical protein BSF38_01940 [Paludisphaera borealis]
MRFMEHVSAGQALFVSAITGGPSLVYASVQEDFAPVAAGAAVGFLAFLLTIWRSSGDSRFETVLRRLDKAEKEADDYRNESTDAKSKVAELLVELAAANARLKLNDDA